MVVIAWQIRKKAAISALCGLLSDSGLWMMIS